MAVCPGEGKDTGTVRLRVSRREGKDKHPIHTHGISNLASFACKGQLGSILCLHKPTTYNSQRHGRVQIKLYLKKSEGGQQQPLSYDLLTS